MRKTLNLLLLLLTTLPALAAWGQAYPARPIRIVVGTPAGSGIDVAVRILGERLREELGQPIVIELKPGADGIIAGQTVATSAPDGYTLWAAANGNMAINPIIHANLSYDPLRDFEPVSLITRNPSVLVAGAGLPVKSVPELIAYARARPGTLNYGSSSSNYMFAMERFTKLAAIDLYHIPYSGNPQVLTALLAGEIHVAMVSLASAGGHVAPGKLRALAVTGPTREPQLPDVPTLAEAGVRGYDLDVWVGIFAPAGVSKDIITRLHAAIQRSIEAPEIRERMIATGLVPVGSTPQSLRETIVRDTNTYRGLATSIRPGAK